MGTDYRELETQAKQLKCACGGSLTVAWQTSEYRLRCGRDKAHTEFVKRGDPVIERFEAMKGKVASEEVIDLEIEAYKIQEGKRVTAKRSAKQKRGAM